MKKFIFLFTLLLLFGSGAYAQKVIKIGDTEYTFRSPFKIQSATRTDSLGNSDGNREPSDRYDKNTTRKRTRYIDDFVFGIGFMCPIGGQAAQPVYFGNSFNLDIGWKFLYLPTSWYGIGGLVQYSAYSYKLKTDGKDLFNLGVATTNGTHYYRTDNIGTGIINRFYLFPARKHYDNKVFIELGAWGDFSYSKRLKIKDFSSGYKEKFKYRDGNKFNPFQAGVQGGIGYGHLYLYCKYRLTNAFNHQTVQVDEVPRFSIGIQLNL